MSNSHRRLSPYVRDEDALQRGIEQTALAQTRAAMSNNPTTAQVLDRLRWGLESLRRLAQFDSDLPEQDNPHGLVWRRSDASKAIAYLSEAITLAQAHADQQARLRALVERWRGKSATDGLFIEVAFPGDTVGRIANQQRNRCADELEAVLGGKE